MEFGLRGVILFNELYFGACVFLVLFVDWNRYWWWLKRRGEHEGFAWFMRRGTGKLC